MSEDSQATEARHVKLFCTLANSHRLLHLRRHPPTGLMRRGRMALLHPLSATYSSFLHDLASLPVEKLDTTLTEFHSSFEELTKQVKKYIAPRYLRNIPVCTCASGRASLSAMRLCLDGMEHDCHVLHHNEKIPTEDATQHWRTHFGWGAESQMSHGHSYMQFLASSSLSDVIRSEKTLGKIYIFAANVTQS